MNRDRRPPSVHRPVIELNIREELLLVNMADPPKSAGSSLWLVPPEDSSLYKAIHSLITTSIPPLYPIALPLRFTPHVTLTANTISSELQQPQQWLNGLKLPDLSSLKMAIREVQVGDIFFQKLTMSCEKTAELCSLASFCRRTGLGNEGEAKGWVEQNYRPHYSLM